MQPKVLEPNDHTATQYFSRMKLPPDWSKLTTKRGDSILNIAYWHNATHALATIGVLPLALQTGRLGRTFSNKDIFSVQASAIADALDLDLEATICQIEEFRSRQDGWKGPNSVGPTKRAIDDAKTFAAVVLAKDRKIERPHIGLAADGEITFFWKNSKITIDLCITGDGTYAYYAKPDTGKPFLEDAAQISENLPEEILRLIGMA